MFTYFAWIESGGKKRDEKVELHACLLVKQQKGGTKEMCFEARNEMNEKEKKSPETGRK
jgi:hypothetical protein